MNTFLELAAILALILFNGFLAMSEIALVSASKLRLRLGASEGKPGYQAALDLAGRPGRFLSSVQVGITLAGILAGAFGTATIAEALAETLIGLGLSSGASEAVSLAVVVAGVTYFSLVIGELAPKQIALLDPERTAALVARPVRLLAIAATPLVRLLSLSTTLVLRLLGARPSREPAVSEDEVKLLIDQGTELGVFEPIEDTIVDRVFQLGDRLIASLATPRTEIIWIDLDDPLPESIRVIQSASYSQFPVARGDLDDLVGYVKANDLLAQMLEAGSLSLEDKLQEPLYIPESTPVFRALERMRRAGTEIAFVMDEYGGIQGLVTLRDLLEGLVGELPEAEEPYEPDVVRLEDGSFLLDGMLPIPEFRELFGLHALPGEGRARYQTLAGFVLYRLGHIPSEGESLSWAGHRIEVVDMDGMRIDKLHVIPPGA
jgi:putative hemolysin